MSGSVRAFIFLRVKLSCSVRAFIYSRDSVIALIHDPIVTCDFARIFLVLCLNYSVRDLYLRVDIARNLFCSLLYCLRRATLLHTRD